MLNRRMKPIDNARLALLDASLKLGWRRSGRGRENPEALFRPVLEVIRSTHQRWSATLFVCLHYAWRTRALISRPLVERIRRKVRAFPTRARVGALPPLSEIEAHWQLHGGLPTVLSSHSRPIPRVLEVCSGGRCRLTNSDAVLQRLIRFCAAVSARPPERNLVYAPVLEDELVAKTTPRSASY